MLTNAHIELSIGHTGAENENEYLLGKLRTATEFTLLRNRGGRANICGRWVVGNQWAIGWAPPCSMFPCDGKKTCACSDWATTRCLASQFSLRFLPRMAWPSALLLTLIHLTACQGVVVLIISWPYTILELLYSLFKITPSLLGEVMSMDFLCSQQQSPRLQPCISTFIRLLWLVWDFGLQSVHQCTIRLDGAF